MPRVLVLTIATHGGAYDVMRAVLQREVDRALPAGWTHVFVHADEGEEESLVPGVARKTLKALKRHDLGDYDYVIRTNLSTLWLWDRTAALLDAAPRERFFAGTTDPVNGDHVCGCCMVWSADVASHLLEQWDEVWESTDPDDVVLTRACRRYADSTPMPRLDVYGAMFPGVQMHCAPHGVHDCLDNVTHLRFKSNDRVFDAATMDAAALVVEYLRATAGGSEDLLLAVHLAQSMALSDVTE